MTVNRPMKKAFAAVVAAPILRTATRSELAAIRLQEAREAHAFSYRLPLTAQYSNAEMDTYAAVCDDGC